MLKTRITESFGIKAPVIMAGMSWITDPKIVAAVSNAGGLGLLALGPLTPDDVHKQIREIRSLTDKPFGINQALMRPLAKENMQAVIEEKVPVVNYSLGKPWFVEQVHAYGGKVVGTIATSKHAVRAAELGVDAIVITGHEAAAHGGAATTLVLIPMIASMVKVPLIAAGGFCNGKGLAAALVLGADAISMGTMFAVTKESPVHEHFKQLIMKASEQDTLYSDVYDGMPGRVLKTRAAEEELKRGFPLFQAVGSAMQVKRMLGLSWSEFIGTSLKMMQSEERVSIMGQARMARHAITVEKAVRDGDEGTGILPAGQVCGQVRDTPTCQELVDRIVREASEILGQAGKRWVA